jgi:hypothetical protein
MRTYTEAEIILAISQVKSDIKNDAPNPYLEHQERQMQQLSEEIGMVKLLCKLIQNYSHEEGGKKAEV